MKSDRRGDIRHDRWVWAAIIVPVGIVTSLALASYMVRERHLNYVVSVAEEYGQIAVKGIYAYREATGNRPEDVYDLVPEYIDQLPGHHVFHFWESDSGPLLSIKVGTESYLYYAFDPDSADFGWTYARMRLDVPPPTTTQP